MKASDSSSSAINQKLKELIEVAHKLGASSSAIISVNKIIVDVSLADKCREPRCAWYGLSKSCPPHISGPAALNKSLEIFNQAIFFKIDIPSEILYSSQNREVFQLLHEIAAGIEESAVKLGFTKAKAYAGGSCKEIFCYNYNECLALTEEQKCRNPEYARPSMSGFGINVAKLFEATGWTMNWVVDNNDSTTTKMGNVCGLVLIY
jgi:predicted metal-binding protein